MRYKVKFQVESLDDPKFKTTYANKTDSYDEHEIDFLIGQFKHLLLAMGYIEAQVSHIQNLEEDEWKYVLTQYREWNDEYERIYKMRKGTEDEED